MSALKGLRVLDLTRDHAGRLVGYLLADQGADVLALGTPRSWVDRGRRFVEQYDHALLSMLAERADVVIDDRAHGKTLLDFAELRARSPSLVTVHLPAFGAAHPLSGLPGAEAVVAAASGLHAPIIGLTPQFSSLSLIGVVSAAHAACGLTAALIARQRDGRGQAVEVIRSDCAYSLLELNALFTQSPPAQWATLTWGAPPFIDPMPTSDGRHIYLHAGLPKHMTRLLAALDALAPSETAALRDVLPSGMLTDPTAFPSAASAWRIRRALCNIFATRGAEEWEQELSAAGLCCVTVHEADAWLDHPHATESQQVIELDGEVSPGLQLQLSATPGEPRSSRTISIATAKRRWRQRPERPLAPRDHTAPLRGITVFDFTQVIAGPSCTRMLAQLGARVLRFENPEFDAPWVEAFHTAFNAGKRSLNFDLNAPGAAQKLQALVTQHHPDIVVQNLRHGAAEKLGIDEAALRTHAPDLIYAHLNAYGDTGPWADRPGWEQTAQAATGIQAAFGGDRGPELFPIAANDLGTGLLAAFGVLCALLHKQQSGESQRVSTCLSATALLLQAEVLLDPQRTPARRGELGTGALERFYRARDGWMLLYLDPTTPDLLPSVPGLEGVRARRAAEAVAWLERAFKTDTIEGWQQRVERSGLREHIAIVPYTTPRQLFADPLARAAGLIHRQDVPGVGAVTETGCPLTLQRTPTITLAPAAVRGCDPHSFPAALPQPQHTPSKRARLRWARLQARGALALVLTR